MCFKANVLTTIATSTRIEVCQIQGQDSRSSPLPHPKGCMWSGRRLTKIQATTRPDYLWPEIWTDMSKAAQKKEKQETTFEKPKLDNARRLRGVFFIDPKDGEKKKTLQTREKC